MWSFRLLVTLVVLPMSCSTFSDQNNNNGEPPECRGDLDCDNFQNWTYPEQVRCESGHCVECLTEAECGEGFSCDDEHCQPKQTCEVALDCGRRDDRDNRLGCVGGYCDSCELDEHCAEDEFCTGRPGDPAWCLAHANVGDPRCADDTCPGNCGFDADEKLQCHVNPYPGVDIPEPGDYSVACDAPSDCELVELLMFANETCECRCWQLAVAARALDEYTSQLPETKSRYGCEAEPDCACDPATLACVDSMCQVDE